MKDIHEIRPPVQVGTDPCVFWYVLAAACLVLVCLAVFFLVRKYLGKRSSIREVEAHVMAVPPHDAALKALDGLEQNMDTDVRLFYFELTYVLKKYIGDTFRVNAPETTSAEFIRLIGRLDIDRSIRKRLNEFVKSSDPFKYAGKIPEKRRAGKDLACVREIISDIEAQAVRKRNPETGAQEVQQ